MFHPSYREYDRKSASDLCKSHSIPTSDNGTDISLSHYPTRTASYRWSHNIPLQSHYPAAWYHGCQEPDAYVPLVDSDTIPHFFRFYSRNPPKSTHCHHDLLFDSIRISLPHP